MDITTEQKERFEFILMLLYLANFEKRETDGRFITEYTDRFPNTVWQWHEDLREMEKHGLIQKYLPQRTIWERKVAKSSESNANIIKIKSRGFIMVNDYRLNMPPNDSYTWVLLHNRLTS